MVSKMNQIFAKEVLATLRESGSEIAKPHRFEFYLYVPQKLNAEKAAKKLRESAFGVEVSRSGKQWVCLAQKQIIPAKANLADYARFLNEIADAVDGEFDGWEAELVESK